jgi:fructokinase
MLLGSIEAGGTKFVCAVGDQNFQIKKTITFPTTKPQETLDQAINFFKSFSDLAAIGIASFGPIEIRPTAAKYGYVTNTPKPNWSNTDFIGYIKRFLPVPIYWTTDVNGSVYGEWTAYRQKGQTFHSLVYYTIGTGIGAGIINDGQFIGTLGHPELGHVYVKRHPADLNFNGICPFHGDCLEGLAAGPTFQARLGIPGQNVALNNPVWDIIAFYIAQALVQTTLAFRPEKIIIGGGVASESFLAKTRQQFRSLLNNYVDVGDLNKYLVMPQVPNNGSATLGDFALAQKILAN